MAGRDWLLGGLMVASLAGNAALFSRWHAARRAQADAAQAAAPPAFTSTWRQPFPGLRVGADGSGAPIALDGCVQNTIRVESQLAELEQFREANLTPRQRFESAPPNPAFTASLTAALAQQFPSLPALGIRAECRGALCRVFIPPALHGSEALTQFRESQFVGENLREIASDRDDVLSQQQKYPDSIRGSDILQNALQDFESSGAVEECQAKFAGEGTLDAEVTIVSPDQAEGDQGTAPGISVHAGGRLQGTQLGNCIDTAFRHALMAIALPDHYDGASVSAQYPKP